MPSGSIPENHLPMLIKKRYRIDAAPEGVFFQVCSLPMQHEHSGGKLIPRATHINSKAPFFFTQKKDRK